MSTETRGNMRPDTQEFEEFVAQVTAAVTGIDNGSDAAPGGVADPWFLDREKIVWRWPSPQEWLDEPPE